mgnify:CR=1 FL=1
MSQKLKPFYDDISVSDRKEPDNGMELMYVKKWGQWEKLFSMEPITHYEIIRSLDFDEVFGRTFDEIREFLKEIESWNTEFDGIFFEDCSIRTGCSEYERKYYVVGKRLETSKETQDRIDSLLKKALLRENKELEDQKIKEDKEKKEFERLSKKFGAK